MNNAIHLPRYAVVFVGPEDRTECDDGSFLFTYRDGLLPGRVSFGVARARRGAAHGSPDDLGQEVASCTSPEAQTAAVRLLSLGGTT